MEPGQGAPHRRVPAAADAFVQRLRRPGGATLLRDGPEEVLLTTAAIPRERTGASRRRLETIALIALCLVPALSLAWRAFTDRLGANPIEELEIQTGLWTLRFLIATLAVTPLRRLTGWNWLAKHRRTLGLVAFSYACLHLSMYIGLDMFFDVGDIVEDVAERLYITVGMLAFLLMIPLAVTSTKNAIRRLGRRWTKLHRLVWAVAALGTIHFLWAVKKDIREPLIYAGIFLTLLLLRIPRKRAV